MKKVGLSYPVVAKYDESTGVPVYTDAVLLPDVIKTSIKWDKNDERAYGSNRLNDIDQSITGGTETLDLTGLPLSVQAMMLGHQFVDGALITNENDVAPYVGHGFIGQTKEDDGSFKYLACWIYKEQFSEPDDDTETLKDKRKFQMPTISGVITKAINGNFRAIKLFDTEVEAQAFIDDISGLKKKCSTPVPSLAAGEYTALEAEDVTLTAGVGEAIYYTLNGTTPSATNGTLYSTPFDITDDCMLRAVSIKAGLHNSDILEAEYFITV